MQQKIFYIHGMHCASCEILIEKKLLAIYGVKAVDASTAKGQVVVEFDGSLPGVEKLNKMFREEKYIFYELPTVDKETANSFKIWFLVGLIIIFFLYFNKLGLNSWISVNADSSLPAFFFFGLLAGLSSCAALVGGLILSMSKQWASLYQKGTEDSNKTQPHVLFNLGRLISYTILGAILGSLGSGIKISSNFSSFLVLAVSFLMFLLALQMLGVQALRRFQITVPKFITRRVADETKFQGGQMPFILGALTFFLPCGFTIVAQGSALISGSAWHGSLIMFFFALGTLPVLLLIGSSSMKFVSRPHLSNTFLKAAGALVLFFSLFNINAQLNALGWSSFSDLTKNNPTSAENNQESGLPPIINGKQIVKMTASSRGYNPDYIKVRAGVPVRWEIEDIGTGGCTGAIISRSLFSGSIDLTPGETSIKEFTPTKIGKFKFSCWMGMVNGFFEVVN